MALFVVLLVALLFAIRRYRYDLRKPEKVKEEVARFDKALLVIVAILTLIVFVREVTWISRIGRVSTIEKQQDCIQEQINESQAFIDKYWLQGDVEFSDAIMRQDETITKYKKQIWELEKEKAEYNMLWFKVLVLPF